MSNLAITIISSISLVILLLIAIIIVKKRVTKIGKILLWFFIPVYLVSWLLYFCAIYNSNLDIPLVVVIIETSVVTLKSFALFLNVSVVSDIIKANTVYTIAICIAWFFSSFNTLYILILTIFAGFKDYFRAKLIKIKPHYIVIVDDLEQLTAIGNLNMQSIIILNNNLNLKNQARKYSCKQYCFIYNDNPKEALIAAGVKTKGTIILSLSLKEDTNLSFMNILNDIIPTYNKSFINYDMFDIKKYVDNSKNIIVYNMADLVARDFISKYPLYQQIDKKLIDYSRAILKDTNIKHFFLGFNNYSEQILCNIASNYQMVNDIISFYICDENANKLIDDFNGRYYVNKHIDDIANDLEARKEYFDLEASRFKLNAISYEKNSYELKKEILKNVGSYNLYYIDYNDDKINFEKAIELDDLLKNLQITNYKIYVRFSIDNQFNLKELNNRNILIYGQNADILSKRIIIDQELDDLAKMVNYFYATRYGSSNEDVDYLWNSLSLLDKNSNRSAAMNIITKLNLIGLTLAEGNAEDRLSNEEYYEIYADNNMTRSLDMSNYSFTNKRINLGILEHYRWNNFQILNGIHPMKKALIFENNKYNRKRTDVKLHSNILSLKGLLELENYLASWDMLTPEGREKESQILIKDFDLMDNLPAIIENANLSIIKLK